MKNEKKEVIKVTLHKGEELQIEKGKLLYDLSKEVQKNYNSVIVAAKVNNVLRELSYELHEDSKVEFIDLSYEDGSRIYTRSLTFVLIKAVSKIFPDKKVSIGHSINRGIYCDIDGKEKLTVEDVKKIEDKMKEIVNKKIPFIKQTVSLEEAKKIFKENGMLDKFGLVEHREKPYVTMYSCGSLKNYFYGYMVHNTGDLREFKLEYYESGVVLMFPHITNPEVLPEFKEQTKLFNVFQEYREWNKILGVENVAALNSIVKDGNISEFIQISEALHEKKIAQISDMIKDSPTRKRVILISGPSSSGKTTFAHRLSIQLRANGLKPVMISMDNYFINREETPKDENGNYDFENLNAIDIKLFNEHLGLLTKGEEVEVPRYNFHTGKREEKGEKLQISEENLVIIEGIHALNEVLTTSIPRDFKFKIYVSALTSMNIDDHNRIPTTDTRFIRRIVRDNQFRGISAVNTIKQWPSVRRGEEKNIFPFQEDADIMFNSSLIYELGTLKKYAEELLSQVDVTMEEYSEAKRLREFLSNFLKIDATDIPFNSILREFVGGSCFH